MMVVATRPQKLLNEIAPMILPTGFRLVFVMVGTRRSAECQQAQLWAELQRRHDTCVSAGAPEELIDVMTLVGNRLKHMDKVLRATEHGGNPLQPLEVQEQPFVRLK